MRTGSLICLRVRKRLCVSVLGGKPSIYLLLDIEYFLRPSVVSCRVPSSSSVVVVRPLSVRPVVVVRPLSVRPGPSKYYLQDVAEASPRKTES